MADDEVSLKELILKAKAYFRYLRSQWKILLLCVLLGAGAGALYSKLKTTTYKGVVSFVLEEDSGGGGIMSTYAGIASQFGINLGGIEGAGLFTGDNIIEFLKSRRMIQETLLSPVRDQDDPQTLIERYLDFTKMREAWPADSELHKLRFSRDSTSSYLLDSIVSVIHKDLLKEYLTIDKPNKKLSIIAVECESPDPYFSKYFAETLIKNVSEFYTATKTKKSQDNLNIISEQVDSIRNELNKAISGVASEMQANPNSNPILQSLRVGSQKRQVDVSANTAILTELVKNQELARITLNNDRPLIQVLDRPIFPLEKREVSFTKGAVIGAFAIGFIGLMIISVGYLSRYLLK